MRWVVLVAFAVILAGCSESPAKPGPGNSQSTTTTAPQPANSSALPPTAAGLPVVAADRDIDLALAVQANGEVHRVRIVAFKPLTLDAVTTPGGGGGGGGFGGGGATPVQAGVALFPAEGNPRGQPPCTTAIEYPVWDGRVRFGEAGFEAKPGIYDLWVWSAEATTVTIELNGGGDAVNVTAQAHNWTATFVQPAVTKSGPAQTSANFDEPFAVAEAALALARYTPPNGYPDEAMGLRLLLDGSECSAAESTSTGNPFQSESLVVAAFLGPGQATLAGRYTASASPLGEGSASLLVLQPN